MADNNPGNLPNGPKEEVEGAAEKGSHSSADGFALMDSGKHVSSCRYLTGSRTETQRGCQQHTLDLSSSGYLELSTRDHLSIRPPLLSRRTDSDYSFLDREDVTSQGGQASSGSFEPGGVKAKEPGRKGD